MIDFGISAGKLATLGAACVALLVAAPLAFAVRDELRRIAKPASVVSLAFLSVCLAHFVVHGSLKTNGVGKLNAKGAEFAKVAEREGGALSRPHGDEASSLVVSKAKQPTQAEFFTRAWNIRGAWEDSFWMDFADDFVFPWGTNRLNGVEVLSQGRVQTSHRDTNAIASVGVALSMVPGVSRFAYEHTPSNTYRFAWSHAAVGRVVLNASQYETMNASIELFRNGDSVITTNGVARRVKYVNPYDLDGDGLANWIDPHPSESDGNCFGTGVDWLNLNCGGVLSATTNAHGGIVLNWEEGANPNAYYWLTFTSLADNNRISVACDGASNLGDLEIIANEGQVCRIPLLAGAEYTIESTEGIGDVSANDDDAVVEEIEVGRKYRAKLPLDFSFSSGGGGYYYLETSPLDVGAKFHTVTGGCCAVSASATELLFSCSGDCGCAKGRAKPSDAPVLANIAWEGYVKRIVVNLPCKCLVEVAEKRREIDARGASIEILDSLGEPIPWAEPILVGESLLVEVKVGGDAMSDADFVDLFAGQLRLRSCNHDFDGEHVIADEPLSVRFGFVSDMGNNTFRVSVPAGWMAEKNFTSNTEDGVFSKTSIDMSAESGGGSSREDSDVFDAEASGALYGRARGMSDGDPSAYIPEGALNKRTVQAAGTASLTAYAASASSAAKQCQKQADVLYYSGHGIHENGALYGQTLPSDVAAHWADVDTVVFAGCSVLDLDDRNGNYEGSGHTASPGRKWIAASHADVLLGYAYKAPLDSQGGTRIVREWCEKRRWYGDVAAWMEANDNANGSNACAIRRMDSSHVEYNWFKRENHELFGVHLMNTYEPARELVEVGQ